MAMNLLSGLQYVQQQGEAGRQRGLEDRFNRLAGEAFNAPDNATRDAAVGQVAVNNPRAAFGLKAQFQADEDRQTKLLVNGARYMKGALDSKNPNAVAGAWRTVRPSLIRAGLATEQELSPDWDPSYEQTVHQVLAMGDPNATGSVLQSQKIGADGYIYNSFRDGRMVNTGVKADRQAWFRDQPGIPAGIVDKNGVFTPLGESGGDPSGAVYEDGQPVATTTAVDASGVPVNIGNDIPPDASAAILAGNANGVQSNGFMPINRVSGVGSAGTATRPSAAQDAAAVEQAKVDVQLRNLPAELNMRTDAALREAGGKAAVEAQAKRQAVQAENDRSFSLYDTAMKGVAEGLRGASTGPITGRLPAVTANQQKAEGGVSAIAPILKQMFRSAGEGTFTDKDQDLLMAMIPTRADHPEARDWKIANIDRIVREKLGQPERGAAPASQGGSQQPAVRIQSADDYSRLPAGALYIDPTGMQRRKR